MKSRPLSDSLRADILQALRSSTVGDKIDNIDKELNQLADEIYIDFIGDKMKHVKALPEHFMDSNKVIRVSFGDKNPTHINMSEYRRTWQTYNTWPKYAEKHPFAVRHRDIAQRKKDATEEWDNIRTTARGIINSVKTTKQLLDVWPDAVNYLPKQSEPTAAVPMVQAETLNCLIANAKGDKRDCDSIAA